MDRRPNQLLPPIFDRHQEIAIVEGPGLVAMPEKVDPEEIQAVAVQRSGSDGVLCDRFGIKGLLDHSVGSRQIPGVHVSDPSPAPGWKLGTHGEAWIRGGFWAFASAIWASPEGNLGAGMRFVNFRDTFAQGGSVFVDSLF